MPGPGSKRMKPYGLVAAASITSQMSIPIRSVSSASSLTSAMFTARKMFSSSFVSSATSGVDDAHDLAADEPVELLGAVAAGLGQPADHLRRVRERVVGAARVDALGREREVEVDAGAQAAAPRAAARRARASCPGRWSTRRRRAGPARSTCPSSRGAPEQRRRGPARGWRSAASARRSASRRPRASGA